MADDRLHDLFTVFTFKTPPSGDFVYERTRMVGRARRARHGATRARALPTLRFRNCAQNQVAQPGWMGDSRPVRSEGFPRRIHPQISVRAVGVLPAPVPEKGGFGPR